MKLNKTIYAVAIAGVALSSCGDDLEYKEYTAFDQEYIERTFGYVGGFMTTIYNDIDTDWGNLSGAMLSSATDESEYSHSGNSVEDFLNGNWSAANPHQTIWTSAYGGITYCNEFLDNWTELEFKQYALNSDYAKQMFRYKNYKWEARWARAYFYFTLVRQYGAVPFKEHNTNGEEESALPCTSADQIFAFIQRECDAIKDSIVADYTDLKDLAVTSPETGRASKYAVLALKAQAALYHASPLFNPNNDPALWKEAALANKELIDACEAAGKKLASDYTVLWDKEFYANADASAEILFARRTTAARTFESYNFPVGYSSGQGGNCPTQDLVDAYCCTDGLSIAESPLYDPQNPYVNRDPRLAMTVAVNGEAWPVDGANTTYPQLQTYQGGYHSRTGAASGASYATPTGYYLKKFCNPSQILRSGYQTTSAHGWLTFRLGGMYLNYAEALFQYFKSQGNANAADAVDATFRKSAREMASKTRQRVKMPAFKTGMSNDEFWTNYKRERQVELAFEGHRFYDVRRWKEDGQRFLNIHRMEIVQNIADNDTTYTYNTVAVTRGDGQWQEKWNLFPFSQTEVLKSGGAIQQNPGW